MTSRIRVQHLARALDERRGSRNLPLLSVSASRGVIRRSEITDNEPRADDLSGYRVCNAGNIVINRMSAYQGALGQAREVGIVSPDYLVLELHPNVSSPFIEYLFRSPTFVGEMTSRVRGIGSASLGTVRTPRINWIDLGNIEVDLPTLTEQRQIVEYLDRETGQIDALISKQEQLVETLTERRQAVITHAVTRGLDPAIELKNSATKWWGNIPVPWSIAGLKHLVSIPITDGPHETPTFLADGVEFISASAISNGSVNFEKRRGYISTEDHALYSTKYSPRLHDIYMVKSGATTGVSAILTEDRDFSIWSPLAALRSNDRVNPFFMHFAIQSQAFQRALSLAWTFGTQQNIGMNSIGELQIPVPPRSEQDSIALHLQEHISKTDALSAKALQVIEVLKERRQAVISAAVTGKIDVRGL